ncbi:phage lytic cycle repressor MrpR family protein [Butyrivibrio sp. INlla21]|uniref:phage lytic cycle repressor MrpR family protein n=1 Tax=Butyrivibrio sp. INlla21 TaxID=1520811 RepID=UPI0008EF1666|nr:hypothetical protein [Butyrivibrio sp. INlla21]SFU57602.1 hypothetical protein SAMN02910342_00955 [Butyrivibrio sp. INlla21]
MYNEEFKRAYIQTVVKTGINKTIEAAATQFFNQAAPVEEALQKDLSNFNITEILGLLKHFCTPSMETLMMGVSNFRRYTYYCIEQNMVSDGINHYEEVTNEMYLECVNKSLAEDKIVSREGLLKQVHLLENPVEKFVLFAVFEGLGGVGCMDLVDIQLNQFKDNKVTLRSGRELSVPEELIDIARESADEYFYYPPNATSEKHERVRFKDEPGIIKSLYNVKDYSSDRRKAYNIVNKLRRISDREGTKAFLNGHLVESGRIDLIKRTMKEQGEEDPRKAMRSCRDEMKIRYGEIQAVGRWLLKYEKYLG